MAVLFDKLCTDDCLFSAWKQVKAKKSAGGIDGFTVLSFEENLHKNLKQLQEELKSGHWNPEPYLRVEIPKNESEKRKLGLLSIKDKIVQQGIKTLIEPRFEKLFYNNSYGYRPEKGHAKAIRRTRSEMQKSNIKWLAKLDIDDYFDTIDHALLFSRIGHIVKDSDITRLIELSVKTGVVSKKLKWNQIRQGVPQGAVLSPLLSNFYLHPFDQFVRSKTEAYVRYADDFVIMASSEENMKSIVDKASEFLSKRLFLKLNQPYIGEVKNGIPFLGLLIYPDKIKLSDEKHAALLQRIRSLSIHNGHFTGKSLEAITGIKRYYAPLLPENAIRCFDDALMEKLTELLSSSPGIFPNVKQLQENLKLLPSFSRTAELEKPQLIKKCTEIYLAKKKEKKHAQDQVEKTGEKEKNRQLINQKKRQYQRMEGENSELIITSFGCFIGKSNHGISLKIKGKNQKIGPSNALKHITVITRGVSISGDAVYYCMQHGIPIDFFDRSGKLYASILSPQLVNGLLWEKQANLSKERKMYLAAKIVEGKLKNQLNLVKYFHKYHKEDEKLIPLFNTLNERVETLLEKVKSISDPDGRYAEKLTSYEAAGATAYWAYIRKLIADDGIAFENRERKGATDLFNSLLNYGYAILYARMWQAVLHAGLNPALSVLHAAQAGKPTLVYDMVEVFRAQAVDRVVIGLIQKKEPLSMQDKLLDENTKALLIRNILERLNRYETYRKEETKFLHIMRKQAGEWADYITEKNKSFKPYVSKW